MEIGMDVMEYATTPKTHNLLHILIRYRQHEGY
jgi:hypothetical protein